ncbi:TRAP transporter small permease [Microbacterium sp. No. 7]|uniref:TRAP transporter small permease n=1 Tax=Microbacterium sp. No. 7 TaxID=1714373 RepID=UPI0006D1F7D5|nr:TRAP transporter small permease [Microbacterium sp. No. 7]ALJ18398.1 hypothetical protein AOA12_00060 [Microbacterium sp. No. 7]
MDTLNKVLAKVSDVTAVLSAIAVVIIMVLMVAEVLARNVFTHRSVPGSYELTETLVVLVMAFGLMSAERLQANPRVTLLTDALSPFKARRVRFLGQILSTVVVVWFAYGTVLEAIKSTQRGQVIQGLVVFPVWPTKIVLALGFVLLSVYFVSLLMNSVAELVKEKRS